MPTDELIEHMKRRYSTRKNAKDARDPIPIKMKSNDPVGLEAQKLGPYHDLYI